MEKRGLSCFELSMASSNCVKWYHSQAYVGDFTVNYDTPTLCLPSAPIPNVVDLTLYPAFHDLTAEMSGYLTKPSIL